MSSVKRTSTLRRLGCLWSCRATRPAMWCRRVSQLPGLRTVNAAASALLRAPGLLRSDACASECHGTTSPVRVVIPPAVESPDVSTISALCVKSPVLVDFLKGALQANGGPPHSHRSCLSWQAALILRNSPFSVHACSVLCDFQRPACHVRGGVPGRRQGRNPAHLICHGLPNPNDVPAAHPLQ